MHKHTVLELIGAGEIARRRNVTEGTALRRLAAADILPDAIAIAGSKRFPLWQTHRALAATAKGAR